MRGPNGIGPSILNGSRNSGPPANFRPNDRAQAARLSPGTVVSPPGNQASEGTQSGRMSSGLPRSISVNWPKMVPESPGLGPVHSGDLNDLPLLDLGASVLSSFHDVKRPSPGLAEISRPLQRPRDLQSRNLSRTSRDECSVGENLMEDDDPYFFVPEELDSFHNSLQGVRKCSLIPQHPSSDFVSRYYEKSKEIGKGTFGHVFLVREKATGYDRVCKEVSFQAGCCDKPQQVLELTRQEVQLMAELDHPSLVKVYEFSEDRLQSRTVFIMEYVDGGDCHMLLSKTPTGQPRGVHEHLVGQVVSQLLVATAYIHGCSIVHRDIKPENVLLKRVGRGEVICKLVDFGLASRGNTTGEFVGTPSYFSPEVVNGRQYTRKSDVWAVGILAVELLTGQLPFGRYKDHKGDINQLFRAISAFRSLADFEVRLQPLSGWNRRSVEFIQCTARMLHVNAELRPEAKLVALDPWCEKHRITAVGLTRTILQSLANYTQAPPPVRCCLLAIAVRCNVPEQEALGSAFIAADVDGDGKISTEDLEIAVERARNWWDPDVNTSDLVHLADLDHSGGLSYSEFVAACLYDEEGSLDQLAADAFNALDEDRDGKLYVKDIRSLFPELDVYILRKLSQSRPVSLKEWTRCFVDSCAAFGGTEPRHISPISCGVDIMTCVQVGDDKLSHINACDGLLREASFSESEQNAPPMRARRLKKGSVECWGFPCAGED